MDTKAFGIVGALTLVAGVLGYTAYRSKKSQGKAKNIQASLILKILEELKFQIFMMCLQYAYVFQKATQEMKKKNKSAEQISNYKESQMVKIFQERQKQILARHGISKDQFENALNKTYSKVDQIQIYNEQIENLLLDATKGKTPSLQVSQDLKKTLRPSLVLQILKDMHISIIRTILEKCIQYSNSNQSFYYNNIEDRMEYIKKNSLFELRSKFIQQNGPKINSCNYLNFIKLVESYKKQSPQFKAKTVQFQGIFQQQLETKQKINQKELKSIFDQVLQSVPVQKQSQIIQEVSQSIKKDENHKENNGDVQISQNTNEQTHKTQQKEQKHVISNDQLLDVNKQTSQPSKINDVTQSAHVIINQDTQAVSRKISQAKQVEQNAQNYISGNHLDVLKKEEFAVDGKQLQQKLSNQIKHTQADTEANEISKQQEKVIQKQNPNDEVTQPIQIAPAVIINQFSLNNQQNKIQVTENENNTHKDQNLEQVNQENKNIQDQSAPENTIEQVKTITPQIVAEVKSQPITNQIQQSIKQTQKPIDKQISQQDKKEEIIQPQQTSIQQSDQVQVQKQPKIPQQQKSEEEKPKQNPLNSISLQHESSQVSEKSQIHTQVTQTAQSTNQKESTITDQHIQEQHQQKKNKKKKKNRN